MTAVPRLEVRGLRKVFGSKVVLDGIDLTVAEHEVVALIGPSGCGKSTLLRCLDLLETADGGTIRLDGALVTGPGVRANDVRKRIGIVFQSFNLFPHLSVLDNVTLAPRRVHDVRRKEAEDRAREVLIRLGLRRQGGRLPGPPLRRPAAAGSDRPRPGERPDAAAARRDHLGPRPRAGWARCWRSSGTSPPGA